MTGDKQKIYALLNLLEDEDSQVSTPAMEELLQFERDAEDLVKEFQEAANPRLRGRIHQLGNILNVRRRRHAFIQHAMSSSISLWDGMVQINYQYNPRLNPDQIASMADALFEALPPRVSTVGLGTFMRNEDFSYTRKDTLGADLFLLEDVLAQRIGAPIVLCVIARHFGEKAGWNSSIVLYRGRHCLIDSNSNLIEPAEGWKVTRLTHADKLYPCGDRDIWLTVLSQLFLAAMLEDQLQAIHRVGIILAELCGGKFQDLPFPLGD